MQSSTDTRPVSRKRLWTGRIVSGLAVLFLLFDGVIKLMQIAPVRESFERLGYPPSVAVGIGLVELACLALYLIPRTSVFGAILLTGFLGGATATHTRVGDPLFSHVLFPTYVGILVWAGLFLREARLRALVPLRSLPGERRRDPLAATTRPRPAFGDLSSQELHAAGGRIR